MKKSFLYSFAIMMMVMFLTSCGSKANKESSFWVRGNCEMCQERIVQTLKGIKGVEKADWNVETKMAKVAYDSTLTNVAELNKAVANVGHETESAAVNAKAHTDLPECCQKHSSVHADPLAGAVSSAKMAKDGIKCCQSSCCDHKSCLAMDGKEKCGDKCCHTGKCTKSSNACCAKAAGDHGKCCGNTCCEMDKCAAMKGKEDCGKNCCKTDNCKKSDNACCKKG